MIKQVFFVVLSVLVSTLECRAELYECGPQGLTPAQPNPYSVSINRSANPTSSTITFTSDFPNLSLVMRTLDFENIPLNNVLIGSNRLVLNGINSEIVMDIARKLNDNINTYFSFRRNNASLLNLNAQETHAVRALRRRWNLSGAGINVGIFDSGNVFTDHQEFSGRVNAFGSVDEEHATHVAGTVGAQGICAVAEGVAPAVTISSYQWSGPPTWNERLNVGHAASDPNNPITISNHSYNPRAGWREGHEWWGQSDFGKYMKVARDFDDLVHANPTLSVFAAAGNDRDDHPYYIDYTDYQNPIMKPFLGCGQNFPCPDNKTLNGLDGFGTITGRGIAKNVISIGAIDDMISPLIPQNIAVTDFSNWGPTDDGRIKPDLVANGFRLISPVTDPSVPPRTNLYRPLDGTSMAAPVASGIGALLNELSLKGLRGRVLYADEMKAALIHTAMSPAPGPRGDIGWGSIRADLAGALVAGEDSYVLLRPMATAADFLWTGNSELNKAIRVTLVWIDESPATLPSNAVDDPMPVLVNDLDMTLQCSACSDAHHPWSLDPSNPRQARKDMKNSVDNVERVDVEGASAGRREWDIKIRIPSNFVGRPFALAISGLSPK